MGDEVLKLKARVSCECSIKPETFDIKRSYCKAKVTFNPAKYKSHILYFVDTNTTPSYVTLPIYANIIKTKTFCQKRILRPEKAVNYQHLMNLQSLHFKLSVLQRFKEK